jgi:hypothetical protein
MKLRQPLQGFADRPFTQPGTTGDSKTTAIGFKAGISYLVITDPDLKLQDATAGQGAYYTASDIAGVSIKPAHVTRSDKMITYFSVARHTFYFRTAGYIRGYTCLLLTWR